MRVHTQYCHLLVPLVLFHWMMIPSLEAYPIQRIYSNNYHLFHHQFPKSFIPKHNDAFRKIKNYDQKWRLYVTSSQEQTPQKKKRKRRKSSSKQKNNNTTNNSKMQTNQTWRIFGIDVHPDALGFSPLPHPIRKKVLRRIIQVDDVNEIKECEGNDEYLSQPVIDALCQKLKLKIASTDSQSSSSLSLPNEIQAVRVIRRSLDARKKRRRGATSTDGPLYTYVLDVDISATSSSSLNRVLKHQPGRMELLPSTSIAKETENDEGPLISKKKEKKRVIVVGAGPAGLFCALQLAKSGDDYEIILLERGQSVEKRGKDIGSLIHRRVMNEESNFAFGEGGAGTWSDGKLTTRIGRNSQMVRSVLEILVQYGAPRNILYDGAPHLGTNNLVRLLQNMRNDLLSSEQNNNTKILFGSKVTNLLFDELPQTNENENRHVATGVEIEYTDTDNGQVRKQIIQGDMVVVATGHSARDFYQRLHEQRIVKLEPKGFAAGFRIEHPQCLLNKIQYGKEWGSHVYTGRASTDSQNQNYFASTTEKDEQQHVGVLPVSSYRLATDQASDGTIKATNEEENLPHKRGVYSFCMCPGGQIVPASTNPDEVCVNGMSFSNRDSVWANSALVVTVDADDPLLESYRIKYGKAMAGIEFQKDMERRASIMGGGNLTVPVQRVTDFLDGVPSTSAPSSSYRLGVKPSACHSIYPPPLMEAMRNALLKFEEQMPGYVCQDALLHAVETRTSSPVRICRDNQSYQASGITNLFPAGEGAGYAGGIVSAAVDGLTIANAIMDQNSNDQSSRASNNKNTKSKSVGFNY